MAEETAVDTVDTNDTGADTGDSGDSGAEVDTTEHADATDSGDGTEADDASAEGAETDDSEEEPDLFMSPGAQKLKAQQQKVKDALKQQKTQTAAQKGKMPDSVRAKIEADVRGKVEKEYEWAKGIDAAEAKVFRTLFDIGNRDPLELVHHLIQRLAPNPLYRDRLEKYLGNLYQPKKTQEDPEPQPDIPTSESNGKPVVYSAAQQKKWGEWQKRQLMQEITKQNEPLKAAADKFNAQQTEAKMKDEANAWSGNFIGQMRQRQGFNENQAEIAALYNTNVAKIKLPPNPNEERLVCEKVLVEAYYEVMNKKAAQNATKKVVQDLKNKEGNKTVANPGGATTQTAKKPKNMRESARQAAKALGMVIE